MDLPQYGSIWQFHRCSMMFTYLQIHIFITRDENLWNCHAYPMISFFWYHRYHHLVGGIPTPLKNMSSSVGVTIPNIWNNKKVSNHQPYMVPSGKLTVCYWKWPSRNSGFTQLQNDDFPVFSMFTRGYPWKILENLGLFPWFSHLLRLHGLDLIGQGRSLRLQGLQPAHAEIVIKNGTFINVI